MCFTLHWIGGTKRNVEVRWNEHNNPTKNSEPSKHFQNNLAIHYSLYDRTAFYKVKVIFINLLTEIEFMNKISKSIKTASKLTPSIKKVNSII